MPGLGDWLDTDDDNDATDTEQTIAAQSKDEVEPQPQSAPIRKAASILDDDIPGLGEWLGDDDLEAALADEDDDEHHDDAILEGIEEVAVEALSEDDELLEELENSSFDDMLEEEERKYKPNMDKWKRK